jgi:hypothetical protein
MWRTAGKVKAAYRASRYPREAAANLETDEGEEFGTGELKGKSQLDANHQHGR